MHIVAIALVVIALIVLLIAIGSQRRGESTDALSLATTLPRRDEMRTMSPSAMPRRAASSGEMSSVSPKCRGEA